MPSSSGVVGHRKKMYIKFNFLNRLRFIFSVLITLAFLGSCSKPSPEKIMGQTIESIKNGSYEKLTPILFSEIFPTLDKNNQGLIGNYFSTAFPDSLKIMKFSVIPESSETKGEQNLKIEISYSNGVNDRENIIFKQNEKGEWGWSIDEIQINSKLLSALEYANVRFYSDNNQPYYQYLMSQYYHDGIFVDKNQQEYNLLLEQASQHVPEAAVSLGKQYLYGEDKEIDESKAFKMFSIANDKGAKSAPSQIALCYLLGKGTDQNFELSLKYALEGANYEDPEAYNILGTIYKNGYGLEANKEKSFEFYLKGAELGESNCQAWVGNSYLDGIGVEKNNEKGIEYLNKSVAQNNTLGMAFLGVAYYYGKGVNKDTSKGKSLLKEASDMGNSTAEMYLGVINQTEQALATASRTSSSNYRNSNGNTQYRRPQRKTCMWCGGQGVIVSSYFDDSRYPGVWRKRQSRCTHCYGYGFIEE